VQAIIWKASINVQIGSWKQEVAPKKRAKRN